MDVKNKKIVVAGLGKTGFDSAVFLARKGADIFLTEEKATEQISKDASLLNEKGIKTEIGGHTEEFIKDMEMLVVSPGIPDDALPVRYAESRNIPVISEIELAFTFSPSKKIIAITGTDGKTTTTSLTGHIFKEAKVPSVVCGNIGNTFIGEIDKIQRETFVILEVSSFQLERIKEFKPLLGCLLNIDEDHIDRHRTIENYIGAKKRLFINQDSNDRAVLNYEDKWCRDIARTIKSKKFFFGRDEFHKQGVYLKNNIIFSALNKEKHTKVVNIEKTNLWGKGNAENMMAASLIALLCGIDAEAIERAISGFIPLPHRLERVAEKNGVLFINDSKSTSPHSVINALESVETETILIMGGRNKDMSFSRIIPYFKNKVRLIILLGEAKDMLAEEFKECGVPVIKVNDVKEAVQNAFKNAKPGDIVLFSPGCTSFDMFNNYKERGDAFKKEVLSLL